jgi:hypothetical protein
VGCPLKFDEEVFTMANNEIAADIAGAEKKLRQAEFFLACLEQASNEIARDRFRGEPVRTERLDFYFSACLTAAQSVYYVLGKFGGRKWKQMQQVWRKNLTNDGGSRFGRMIGLRDNDVHFALTPAKPLQKFVKDDHQGNGFPYRQPLVHNAAIFGPLPVLEEENPDGQKVSGSVLRGTVGLYFDRDGGCVEATTACREFIEQIRSLLEKTKVTFQ